MDLIGRITARQDIEAKLLERVSADDPEAIKQLGLYLSSADPEERRLIQGTIHEKADAYFWQLLLHCLALGCWEEQVEDDHRVNQEASERIDESIAEMFCKDMNDWEKPIKEAVLQEVLNHPIIDIRYSAAYLLGLRGEKPIIPVLEEMLDNAKKMWKVRAVQALAAIKDERCGLPLIKALAMDRGPLHNEARLALEQLGPLAESAWQKALDHQDEHIRWHAARGLSDPGNVQSMHILAEGLFDESHEVRWATADALARIGASAIPAILAVISRYQITNPSRQAILFALRGTVSRSYKQWLKPLLDVLKNPLSSVEAPAIARRLLDDWEKNS